MSLVVVADVDEITATVRQIVVVHPQTAVLDLHRLVVPAVRLRHPVRAHPHDVEDARPRVTAQGLHHAGRGVLPLRDGSDEMADGISQGFRATTAGGYLGIVLDLLPLKRKRAHQHPGCQGHDPARRRAAAAAQDPAVHGL